MHSGFICRNPTRCQCLSPAASRQAPPYNPNRDASTAPKDRNGHRICPTDGRPLGAHDAPYNMIEDTDEDEYCLYDDDVGYVDEDKKMELMELKWLKKTLRNVRRDRY